MVYSTGCVSLLWGMWHKTITLAVWAFGISTIKLNRLCLLVAGHPGLANCYWVASGSKICEKVNRTKWFSPKEGSCFSHLFMFSCRLVCASSLITAGGSRSARPSRMWPRMLKFLGMWEFRYLFVSPGQNKYYFEVVQYSVLWGYSRVPIQVILATVKGSLDRVSNHAPQMSAYVLQRAILVFYEKHKLFPSGLCSALPAVRDWALKSGATLKKLVGSWK